MPQEAAGNGAKLIVLPEMFNCPYSNESFPKYAEDINGGSSSTADQLAGFAAEHAVTLVAGSIPESSGDKLYNTCLVFDRHGKQLAKHRKVCPDHACCMYGNQVNPGLDIIGLQQMTLVAS